MPARKESLDQPGDEWDATAAPIRSFIPLIGKWGFTDDTLFYEMPTDPVSPVGVAIGPIVFHRGAINARVEFENRLLHPDDYDWAARVIIRYDLDSGSYYSIGIGGYGFAFVIDRFIRGEGWRAIRGVGAAANLTDTHYDICVQLIGQRVTLSCSDTSVLSAILPAPLNTFQTGLFAWGKSSIRFADIRYRIIRPKAFLIMSFSNAHEKLYRECLRPVIEESGFILDRGDELLESGMVLTQIEDAINGVDVVVAEISEANMNVYFEIGYARALGKPLVLIAKQGVSLPFDISGLRVLYYEDTISGYHALKEGINKYLTRSFRL